MGRKSDSSSLRTELIVSIVAAVAVLASGGVSAFVSWSTTTKTLQSQRDLATDSYLRDSRKALYFDLLEKGSEFDMSVDKAFQAVAAFKNGSSPRIPREIVDEVKRNRDQYNYTAQPMFALAPDDTANLALDISVDHNRYLDPLVQVYFAAEDATVDRQQVRDLASSYLNVLLNETRPSTCLFISLTKRMRRDLGLPPEKQQVPECD